jgi:vancomycin permeability regulator SanA
MKAIGIATAVMLACYLAAAAALALVGFHDHAAPADIIVVPGSTVLPDGTPGERLASRLEAAIKLFNERQAPAIFVSGGVGREDRDEAAAMARYLVVRGVPASAIVQDPLGFDTAATAANAAAYLRANKLRSALVATQYFHVARTTLALERQGVSVTGTRHARYLEWRDLYSLAREGIGYAVYLATLSPGHLGTLSGWRMRQFFRTG